jgi:hypothetical protein
MNRMLIIGVGVAIIGSATTGAALAAAAAASPVQVPVRASAQEQKPVIHRVPHRHRLARRSKPPVADPRTAFAKGRAAEFADTRTVPTSEPNDILRPRSVSTVTVPATPALDVQAEKTIALPVDAPAKAASSSPVSIFSIMSREPAPSRGIEVMMLLGTCAGAAMGVYGLLAFKSRRRKSPASRQSQSTRAGLLSSAANRAARQKLFPHQLAMSFESRLSAGQ